MVEDYSAHYIKAVESLRLYLSAMLKGDPADAATHAFDTMHQVAKLEFIAIDLAKAAK